MMVKKLLIEDIRMSDESVGMLSLARAPPENCVHRDLRGSCKPHGEL